MISAFDLFKIGIGPSSSHTVGPMVAALDFRERTRRRTGLARIRAEIFGSLAWTGRGHGTDVAILLGLLGHSPAGIDPDRVDEYVAEAKRTGQARPRWTGFRPRDRSRLQLHRGATGPYQRHAVPRPRRAWRRARHGHLLFHRRRLRGRRGSGGGGRGNDVSAALCQRRRSAGDMPAHRLFHRPGPAAPTRARAAAARSSTRGWTRFATRCSPVSTGGFARPANCPAASRCGGGPRSCSRIWRPTATSTPGRPTRSWTGSACSPSR